MTLAMTRNSDELFIPGGLGKGPPTIKTSNVHVLCWICEQRKLVSTDYSASRSSKVTILGNVANQVRCSRTGTERPIDCALTHAAISSRQGVLRYTKDECSPPKLSNGHNSR